MTPDGVRHHPYFTENFLFLGFLGMFFALGLVVLAGFVGIVTRRLKPAGPLAAHRRRLRLLQQRRLPLGDDDRRAERLST